MHCVQHGACRHIGCTGNPLTTKLYNTLTHTHIRDAERGTVHDSRTAHRDLSDISWHKTGSLDSPLITSSKWTVPRCGGIVLIPSEQTLPSGRKTTTTTTTTKTTAESPIANGFGSSSLSFHGQFHSVVEPSEFPENKRFPQKKKKKKKITAESPTANGFGPSSVLFHCQSKDTVIQPSQTERTTL